MAIKKTTKSTKSTKASALAPSPAKASKASKKPSRSSLASLFDETDMSEASNLLSEGEHEVRLNSIEISEKPGKGAAAFMEVESIDGDEEGKKGRQMYKLTDEDGAKQVGMAYLKRDLALLGYEDVSGEDLVSTLEELTNEQPMLIVNVKKNGQYTNIYIQGLAENVEAGDDDEDEDETETPSIEIGTRVTFDNDGEEVAGKVLKLKGEDAVIKGDDGEKYQVNLDDLSVEDEEAEEEEEEVDDVEEETEEDEEIAVDSRVTFDNDGDEVEGTVKKINVKKQTAVVEDDDGDEYSVDLSDLTLAS